MPSTRQPTVRSPKYVQYIDPLRQRYLSTPPIQQKNYQTNKEKPTLVVEPESVRCKFFIKNSISLPTFQYLRPLSTDLTNSISEVSYGTPKYRYLVSYLLMRPSSPTIGPIAFSQRKALDNIDLNLVSHRYVSGVVKDDHFVSARSLLASDRSPRGLFQP